MNILGVALRLRTIAPLIVVLLLPAAASAQTASADSVRIHHAASDAQEAFERLRRNNFPWTWPRSGQCDERIGRFCFTHGDDSSDWEPPPEPQEVVAARHRLIAALHDGARRLPGDAWIAGQLVLYLIEANRSPEAFAVTEACRASRPWCSALEGFIHHSRGDAVQANASFDAALDEMASDQRSRWSDLSDLLEGDARGEYRRLTEDERRIFEDRFWRLADPLYMRRGNDRRSEHFSRRVMAHLQEDAELPENFSWGSDLEEILIRYGWPIGWERERRRSTTPGPAPIISHYPARDRQFVPGTRALGEGTGLEPGEWKLQLDRPHTGYSPEYASGFEPPTYHLAKFTRGDSLVILVALEVPADSFTDGEAALIALYDSATLRMEMVALHDGRGELALTIPARPALLSIEALDEVNGRAVRDRFDLDLPTKTPGSLAVSDLLLLRAGEAVHDSSATPPSLAQVTPRMRAGSTIRTGERLGIYWELYGLGTPEPVTITLSLTEREVSWLDRLGRSIGLASETVPIRLRWQEVAEGPVFARVLTVELSGVEAGEYLLELRVEANGREEITTSRAVEIIH